MRIYVYVSQTDPSLLAFTSNESGDNLPCNLGPWHEEQIPGIIVIDADDDPISQTVQCYGFCVVNEGMDY